MSPELSLHLNRKVSRPGGNNSSASSSDTLILGGGLRLSAAPQLERGWRDGKGTPGARSGETRVSKSPVLLPGLF